MYKRQPWLHVGKTGDGVPINQYFAEHPDCLLYTSIVTRDLVQKYTLPDTLVLQRLSEFLMDNISNLTSPNKVSQLLTANETPTNHVTVGKYIKYLCNAFVFYDIKRYDIRGKKYLESSEKFYLCDSGIRYAILGEMCIRDRREEQQQERRREFVHPLEQTLFAAQVHITRAQCHTGQQR